MFTKYSIEHGRGVVVMESRDLPFSAEAIMLAAENDYDAVVRQSHDQGRGAKYFLVVFPGLPEDLYSESALRQKVKLINRRFRQLAQD